MMTGSVVVSDAGPLIALGRCGLLDLLPVVFGQVHVPQAVVDETTANPEWPGALQIADFVHRHACVHVHENVDDSLYRALSWHLDEGEARAISLATRLRCGVLMDERRGRDEAARLGLPLMGVVGVLLKAKQKGALHAIAPHLDDMRRNGYRLAQLLIDRALALAGEA